MADEFNWDDTLAPVVEAAAFAIEGIPDPMRGTYGPAEILFLAWRKAFMADWARYETGMDQKVVALAKKLAGDDADCIVFRQPLVVCTTKSGQHFSIRDLHYNTAPFWFAAYFDIATAALAEDKPEEKL